MMSSVDDILRWMMHIVSKGGSGGVGGWGGVMTFIVDCKLT